MISDTNKKARKTEYVRHVSAGFLGKRVYEHDRLWLKGQTMLWDGRLYTVEECRDEGHGVMTVISGELDPRETVVLKEAPPRSHAGDLFVIYLCQLFVLVMFYVYSLVLGYRFTVPMGKIVLCALGYGGFLYVWVMWEPLGIGWKILDGAVMVARWVSRPVKWVLRGCFAVPRWIGKIKNWSHER